MTSPPTLADLMADPGELGVSCLDCRHNTTMPVALLSRYAAETPFPEAWAGSAVRPAGRGGLTFGRTGRPVGRRGRYPRHSRLDRLTTNPEQARRPWWWRLLGRDGG